jgi:hypothetical protein
VNDELERIWKEAAVASFLGCYPGIRLEGLRKTTKNVQDSQSSDRNLNQGPLEHEAEILTIRPRRSLRYGVNIHFRKRVIHTIIVSSPI